MAYKVAVLMGSPNDADKMAAAGETLEKFGVEADVRVMSAHRTPAKVAEFIGGARDAGYSCLLYTSPSPRDATLSRMPSSA